jgi:hypothetical protein
VRRLSWHLSLGSIHLLVARWHIGYHVIKPFLRPLPSPSVSLSQQRRGMLRDHHLLVGRHHQQCDS